MSGAVDRYVDDPPFALIAKSESARTKKTREPSGDQSAEKTLSDEEVNEVMKGATEALNGREGWRVR